MIISFGGVKKDVTFEGEVVDAPEFISYGEVWQLSGFVSTGGRGVASRIPFYEVVHPVLVIGAMPIAEIGL